MADSLDWLLDRFRSHKDKAFLVWNDESFSYQWLLDQIAGCERRLDEAGVPQGAVVSLEGDYSPAAIAAFIALLVRAAVIVPLTASAGSQRDEFVGIAEVQAVVTVHGCETLIRFSPAPLRNRLLRELQESGHPGLVLFSSGSTGRSKAALHNLTLLLEKFRVHRQSLITLGFLMLDHIGGINTLLYVLSNAGTLVCIDTRDPDVVCAAIDRHRVELLPTSPTFLNLLLISEAYKRHDLSSLKRITYGTEVMPQRTLNRMHEVFPKVELQQTYGLSELGILRSKSKSPDSLWVRVGGEACETKIHEGTLWVKTRSAMLGYLNAPSPFDSEGWFNTGDAVEADGEFIRILGRKSELINVGGEKVYPVEVENVLLEIPNVVDVAVTGEPNPITGQIVVARFNLLQPEDPQSFRRRVREYCRSRLASFKVPAKIEIVTREQHNARFKKMRQAEANVPGQR